MQLFLNDATLISLIIVLNSTEVCGPATEIRFPYFCHLGSNLSVHACHPRGVLSAYWAYRVFSISGN